MRYIFTGFSSIERRGGAAMTTEFRADASPIPGYRLTRPRGGWAGAERWEAIGPQGGWSVVRLIRLARPLSDEQRQTLDALCRLRAPQLWPLMAAIEADGVLGLVTPASDQTLANRLVECQAAGLPG